MSQKFSTALINTINKLQQFLDESELLDAEKVFGVSLTPGLSKFWHKIKVRYEWEVDEPIALSMVTQRTGWDDRKECSAQEARAAWLLQTVLSAPTVQAYATILNQPVKENSSLPVFSVFPVNVSIDALHIVKDLTISATADPFSESLYDMALHLFASQFLWTQFAPRGTQPQLGQLAGQLFSARYDNDTPLGAASHILMKTYQSYKDIAQLAEEERQTGNNATTNAKSSPTEPPQADFMPVPADKVVVGYELRDMRLTLCVQAFASNPSLERLGIRDELHQVYQSPAFDVAARRAAFADALARAAKKFLNADYAKLFTLIRGQQYYGWGARYAFAPGSNGRIDVRRLARFAHEVEAYPFKQRKERNYPAIDVTLILDNSGSMSNCFYENLAACIAILTVLRRIPQITAKLCSFNHILIGKRDPLTALPPIFSDNGTPLHWPLRYISKYQQRRTSKQVIIVITDGNAEEEELTRRLAQSVSAFAFVFGLFYVDQSNASDATAVQRAARQISYVLGDAPTIIYHEPKELITKVMTFFEAVLSMNM